MDHKLNYIILHSIYGDLAKKYSKVFPVIN